MSGVTIRGYSSEQPRILSDYLDILISSSGETYWTKGYVDGALDTKFRSFEFDSGNLLQAIYELATKFEAIIEFDSVQSKVNMYAKENYGRDWLRTCWVKHRVRDYGKGWDDLISLETSQPESRIVGV